MPAPRWQLNRFLKTPGTVLLGVLLCAFPLTSLALCQPNAELQAVRWQQVVDGDTLRLADGQLLRLVGINTPELARKGRPSQPLSEAASQSLSALLPEKQPLYIQLGQEKRDRYGRLLATVFTAADGGHVGEALLAQGLGWHVVVPPNTDFIECLQAAERRAREQGLGVWSLTDYAPQAAKALEPGEGGFMRVRGRVNKVAESRRAWWIELDSTLSLRLGKTSLELFEGLHPQQWLGEELIVRGWIHYRGPNRKGYPEHVLSLSHPAMLERFPRSMKTP